MEAKWSSHHLIGFSQGCCSTSLCGSALERTSVSLFVGCVQSHMHAHSTVHKQTHANNTHGMHAAVGTPPASKCMHTALTIAHKNM